MFHTAIGLTVVFHHAKFQYRSPSSDERNKQTNRGVQVIAITLHLCAMCSEDYM